MSDALTHALRYLGLGWVLTPIPAGTKAPARDGWNTPAQWIDTPEKAEAAWARGDESMGLIHAPSRTVALDVDDVNATREIFAEFGLDLDALLGAGCMVRGNPTRAKAIYALPDGVAALPMHKMQWGRRALFELRAGPVQDVLPPSAHPQHGVYQWLTPPNGHAPTLPPDLAEFWCRFAELRPQVAAMAPGAPAFVPVSALPSARAEGHNDVIGAFNRAHPVPELLERYGYVQKGRRWLAPESSTGIPGVVILGEKCYSHHGSDVLADGHAHDAFDLFRMFEHAGDFPAAVSAASEALGVPVYGDPAPLARVDVSGLLHGNGTHAPAVLASERREAEREIPADLLTPPGALGAIAQYALASSVLPVPLYAAMAAVAVGSVVCARRYVTVPTSNYSSLYLLVVGKSGTGKEHVKRVAERVLIASGAQSLLGPSGFTSAAAVFAGLTQQPQQLAIVDEFGMVLEAAVRARDAHQLEMRRELMELWGRVDGIAKPRQKATAPSASAPLFIDRPAVSLVAMTTPGPFYNALTSASVVGGFLSRFVIAEHAGPRVLPQRQARGSADAPDAVRAWIQQVAAPRSGNLDGLLLTNAGDATRVPVSDAVLDASDAFASDMLAMAARLEPQGLGEMPMRTREIALRLALIAALADAPDTPVVTADVFDWAARFARACLEQTVGALRSRVADTESERMRNEFLAAIRAAGARGVSDRELGQRRPFTSVRRRERADIITDLQGSHLIVRSEVHSGGRGRPRVAWVALSENQETDETDEAEADAT